MKNIDINTLYFPVETRPVVTDNLNNTEHLSTTAQAIVRPDTNEVLGVVSNRYKLVRNKEIFEPLIDTFEKERLHYEIRKAEVVRNGASAYVEFVFPNMKFNFGKKDEMMFRVVAFNSYDYTRSFGLIIGAFRLICSNGLVVGHRFGQITRKHTIGLNIERSLELVKEGFDKFDSMKQGWEELTNLKYTIPQGLTIINDVSKSILFPEKHREAVENIWTTSTDEVNTPKNRWGLYNAFTSEVTRGFKNINTQLQWGRIIDKQFIG